MPVAAFEVDTDAPKFYLDPNSVLGTGRDRPRIVGSKYGFEIVDYDLVREIFRDHRFTPRRADYFRELGASPLIMEFVEHGSFNFMEPPDHDRVRTIVSTGFRPPRIEAARPMMVAMAHRLIDRFIDRGSCDLVGDFTHIYPLAVVAQYVGATPDDVDELDLASTALRRLGQRPLEPEIPALDQAFSTLTSYTARLVADRRASPREDFISEMIAAQAGGEGLTDEEIVWGVAFLFLAGHDTTRFTLASCLRLLAEYQAWETVADDPSLIERAIVEAMRLYPGTPRQLRVARGDFEFQGFEFEDGDLISLNFVGAGRDPRRFKEPDLFDLNRSKPPYAVGFGHGRHICVGAHLARTEIAEAIRVLTSRLTDVAIHDPIPIKASGVIGGFDALRTTFARRAEERRPGSERP